MTIGTKSNVKGYYHLNVACQKT